MNRRTVQERWRMQLAFVAAGLVPLTIYWLTCHRAITWWDTAKYSLAASTLGIVNAPGSLLLTLLGWIVTRIPLGLSSAFTLNLLAGLLGALTIALVARVSCELLRDDADPMSWQVTSAVALGALPLAFGPTHWDHAVKFTPYILTACFTGLILLTLARWWRVAPHDLGLKWLFGIALLVGLDFSVHRTNALLIPGIVGCVMIGRPRAVASLRAWMVGVGGLLAGLSLHLLLMPMAARSPVLNLGMPSTPSRLWEYISLEQMGGGFLFNLFPRRADFFEHQMGDVLKALGATFASTDGRLLLLGALPLLLGLYGMSSMWRRNARRGVAFLVLFATTWLATAVYFNIPERYFRPLDRHYLPCLVIFAVFSAYGAGAAMSHALTLHGRVGRTLGGLLLGSIVGVAATRVVDDYRTRDRSRNYFAHDFASNLLRTLPRNAILLTGGDNDTFPLWYLQYVEGVRADVDVISIPITNASWYVEHVVCAPGGVPCTKPADEMAALRAVAWEEREVVLPGPGSHESSPVDSVRLRIAPTAGSYLMPQDRIVLDVIRANRWRRPVLLAATVSPSTLPWLRGHLRFDGLAYRFMPTAAPDPDMDRLKLNVVELSRYRGYADPRVHIDETSRGMAQNYYAAFVALAGAVGPEECPEVVAQMSNELPLDRLQPPKALVTTVLTACEPLQ